MLSQQEQVHKYKRRLYIQLIHKRALGCDEFKETIQLCFLEASFIHVCLQHEASIDVQLHDGTLCLLQQMALIHTN